MKASIWKYISSAKYQLNIKFEVLSRFIDFAPYSTSESFSKNMTLVIDPLEKFISTYVYQRVLNLVNFIMQLPYRFTFADINNSRMTEWSNKEHAKPGPIFPDIYTVKINNLRTRTCNDTSVQLLNALPD